MLTVGSDQPANSVGITNADVRVPFLRSKADLAPHSVLYTVT